MTHDLSKQFKNLFCSTPLLQYEMVMKQDDMRHLKSLKWSYIVVDEVSMLVPVRMCMCI